jgi:3-hydroxyisobutyrate dehydrogenase-like beta-hydroxyacid dehydrogenase
VETDNRETSRIGLIGLGLVGTALADILLARDFKLIGFDTDVQRCASLREKGAVIADSPCHAASLVDCVILSLPDSAVVDQVLTGAGGVLKSETVPAHCIDTTTGDPEDSVRFAGLCAGQGMVYLDATISGSSRQVAAREGVFMVGGDSTAFAKCQSLFKVLSDKVFYLGPSGSGSCAKLASNLILGLNRLVLAEGLVLAETLGLDPDRFLDLVKQTPAYSRAMDVKGRKMIDQDFAPESRIRQHHKDVSLIMRYAEKHGQELPLSSVHLGVLEQALAAGDGDLDNAAVIRELRRRTSTT